MTETKYIKGRRLILCWLDENGTENAMRLLPHEDFTDIFVVNVAAVPRNGHDYSDRVVRGDLDTGQTIQQDFT